MRTCAKLLALLLALASPALAQDWSSANDGQFVVLSASAQDESYLPQVFELLQQAKRDLRNDWRLELPPKVTLVIHPDLASFEQATGAPWHLAGLANRERQKIDVQRLRILLERGSLKTTLRHEVFHLAQPQDWPRWLAEGAAMLFAGEQAQATPLIELSDAELNALLSKADSRELHLQAAATALSRAQQYFDKLPKE